MKTKIIDVKDLVGNMLIALPNIENVWFRNSVVLIGKCDKEYIVGFIINKPMNTEVLAANNADLSMPNMSSRPNKLHFGGPVATSKGFVLHSNDYKSQDTITISKDVFLTATMDVLHDIKNDCGPKKYIVLLGYIKWRFEEIMSDIQKGNWFISPAEERLMFDIPLYDIWEACMKYNGIQPSRFFTECGKS